MCTVFARFYLKKLFAIIVFYLSLCSAAMADVRIKQTTDTRIARESDGHYYANTVINGVPLRMVIDTGATKLALSRADAARVGYILHNSDFSALGQGVSGNIPMAFLNIPDMRIGTIGLGNVQAVVFDNDSGPSMVGMNVLNRINNIAIHNAVMTLTP
jgi:aspartyl protease family protein